MVSSIEMIIAYYCIFEFIGGIMFHIPLIHMFEKINKLKFRDFTVGDIVLTILFLPIILLIVTAEVLVIIIMIISKSSFLNKIFGYKPFNKK